METCESASAEEEVKAWVIKQLRMLAEVSQDEATRLAAQKLLRSS